MLAAEFHYTMDYIDEYMDFPFFQEHLNYLEHNPPVGGLLKAILTGMESKVESRPSGKQIILPGDSASKPKQGTLADFLSDFTAMGGTVR